jgi:hypothetical protein
MRALVMLALLSTSEIYAAPNLLLQCLAKEETALHKEKFQGALYHLNQDFLNELASSNDIALKKNYIEEICSAKKHSPSVGLLRLLLIKENDIYDLSLSEVDASMRPFKMGYINEFQKQVPHLFVQFIGGLQAEMATPHCLERAIPEIKLFNERLKYLEDEMSAHEMIKDKTKIERIFTKLQSLKEIKAKCAAEAKNKQKVLEEKVQKQKNSNL